MIFFSHVIIVSRIQLSTSLNGTLMFRSFF